MDQDTAQLGTALQSKFENSPIYLLAHHPTSTIAGGVLTLTRATSGRGAALDIGAAAAQARHIPCGAVIGRIHARSRAPGISPSCREEDKQRDK